LHPVFPSVDVGSGETGVQTFRQSARTLADPDLMIRAIDATSTKPETDTTTEVVTEALRQVVNLSTGTPNVLLESPFIAAQPSSNARPLTRAWTRP
jgi:hypothetical protein